MSRVPRPPEGFATFSRASVSGSIRSIERVALRVAALGAIGCAIAQQEPNRSLPLPVAEPIPSAAEMAPWPGELEKQSIYLHASLSIYAFEKPVDQSPLWRFQGGDLSS